MSRSSGTVRPLLFEHDGTPFGGVSRSGCAAVWRVEQGVESQRLLLDASAPDLWSRTPSSMLHRHYHRNQSCRPDSKLPNCIRMAPFMMRRFSLTFKRQKHGNQGGRSAWHHRGTPTARLRYRVDRPEAVAEGLGNLGRTLPYLFATCPGSGTSWLTITSGVTWTAGPEVLKRETNPHVSVRQVKKLASDEHGSRWRRGVLLQGICRVSRDSHRARARRRYCSRFQIPEKGFRNFRQIPRPRHGNATDPCHH